MSEEISEIKKLAKTGKLVIGSEENIKLLRTSSLAKVYLAKNCPDGIKEDISRYAELAGAELVILDIFNDELKDVCKKPFSISVVGVAKE